MERRAVPRPQRVLIADDSEDLRALWKAFLTYWGFTVDEARNGLEAIQKARAHKPDLILMDCWMPVLDGFSATAQLRDDPALADVPILAVSAAATTGTDTRAWEAGCNAFRAKPLLPEQLMDALRLLMRARGAGEGSRHDLRPMDAPELPKRLPRGETKA